jgi:hypothetical protein
MARLAKLPFSLVKLNQPAGSCGCSLRIGRVDRVMSRLVASVATITVELIAFSRISPGPKEWYESMKILCRRWKGNRYALRKKLPWVLT